MNFTESNPLSKAERLDQVVLAKQMRMNEVIMHAQKEREEAFERDAEQIYFALAKKIQARDFCEPRGAHVPRASVVYKTVSDLVDQKFDLEMKLKDHFRVEGVSVLSVMVENVSFGEFDRGNDETALCIGSSVMCCCLPLLFYWIPAAVVKAFRKRRAYRVRVGVRASAWERKLHGVP